LHITVMTFYIYCLLFPNVDGIYIGATADPDKRYTHHCNAMMQNRHGNYRVQQAFNAYTELPIIKIVEKFEADCVDRICAKEEEWMQEEIYWWGREYLFNVELTSNPEDFAVYHLPKCVEL